MSKPIEVREAFHPAKDVAQLHGFPETQLMRKLNWAFRRSRVTKQFGVEDRTTYVHLTFSTDIRGIQKRQKILQEAPDWDFPTTGMNTVGDLKRKDFSTRNEYHRNVILEAYETIDQLRRVAKASGLRELINIRKAIPRIKLDLDKKVLKWDDLTGARLMILDMGNKEVIPLRSMPADVNGDAISYSIDQLTTRGTKYQPDGWYSRGDYSSPIADDAQNDLRRLESTLRFRFDDALKEGETREQKRLEKVKDRFVECHGENIAQFCFHELLPMNNQRNARAEYEMLLLPLRLSRVFTNLVEWCKKYDRDIRMYEEREIWDDEGRERHLNEFIGFRKGCRPIMDTPQVLPTFNRTGEYNVKGLFPLTLGLEDFTDVYRFKRLDIQIGADEQKIFLAGMHSGGKSFLLENLVLMHLVSQVGLPLLANEADIPAYKQIFFLNSDKDARKGKLESELNSIYSIFSKAGKGDFVLLDELLDSTTEGVSHALVPEIRDMAEKSKARVMLCSHRPVDLDDLVKRGWSIYSPEFERLDNGEIKPTWVVSRGMPDTEANTEYAKQQAKKIMEATRKGYVEEHNEDEEIDTLDSDEMDIYQEERRRWHYDEDDW